MALQLVGTLPVSGVNVGLAASVSGLNQQIAQLQAELTGLEAAVAAKGQFVASLPSVLDPTKLSTALGAALNPAALASATGQLPTAGASLNGSLAIELGAVEAKLAIVEPLDAALSAALGVGGLAAYSYSGTAVGLGLRARSTFTNGLGDFGPGAHISATIIATESPATWGSMARGLYVGDTQVGDSDRLRFLGMLRGSDLSLGVASLKTRISLFLAEVRGRRSRLQSCMQVSLGAKLPDITATATLGANIIAKLGMTGLIERITAIAQLDLTPSITGLNAKINALVNLALELSTDLSAGGLVVWTYSGTPQDLGDSLERVTTNGLPSGTGPATTVYGLLVAAPASNMSTFSSIFLA